MDSDIFTNSFLDKFGEIISEKVCGKILNELQAKNPVKEHDPDELLTFEQTREILHVSKPTLHRWKKEGIIPFERMGGRIYFKRGAIVAAMKSVNLKNQ